MRTVGLLLALVAATVGVAAMGLGAPSVGAQTPSTENPLVACAKIHPKAVFVGTVAAINDDTVTFQVTRVVSGAGTAGTTVEVRYPTEFNARKLTLAESYRVAATEVKGQLESIVQTAQLTACGESTRHPDGTRIDTGALAGVKTTLPPLAKKIGLGLLAVLIALLLLNRLFDRRSRYR